MIGLSVNFSQSLPCIIYQYIIYLSSIKTSRGPVGTLIPFVRPFVCAFVRLSVCLMASLMVAMPMPMPMMMMKLSGGHCRSLPLTMNIPPLWMLIGTNTRLPVDHHTWFSPAIVASSKIHLPWLSGHTVLKLTPPDKRVYPGTDDTWYTHVQAPKIQRKMAIFWANQRCFHLVVSSKIDLPFSPSLMSFLSH